MPNELIDRLHNVRQHLLNRRAGPLAGYVQAGIEELERLYRVEASTQSGTQDSISMTPVYDFETAPDIVGTISDRISLGITETEEDA